MGTNVVGVTSPYWVRAVRTGNTFAGYISPDGINWAQVGTTQTIGMATNGYYIGLPVSSRNTNFLCTATFRSPIVSSNLNSGSYGNRLPINLALSKSASGNLVIQWPYTGNLDNISLFYTPTLQPPVAWTVVTNSLILSSNRWSII